MNENERFEIINRLYYRETGHLRPGKDDPLEDTGSQENIDRFALFCQENLLNRAIESIQEQDLLVENTDWLSKQVDDLEKEVEKLALENCEKQKRIAVLEKNLKAVILEKDNLWECPKCRHLSIKGEVCNQCLFDPATKEANQ